MSLFIFGFMAEVVSHFPPDCLERWVLEVPNEATLLVRALRPISFSVHVAAQLLIKLNILPSDIRSQQVSRAQIIVDNTLRSIAAQSSQSARLEVKPEKMVQAALQDVLIPGSGF